LQLEPLGCFWQLVPMQLLPPELFVLDGASALQSPPVLVHDVLHWLLLASHWYAPHETWPAGWQLPMPSQAGAGIRASDSEAALPPTVPVTAGAQLGAPQTVPAAKSSQPPAPSHLPVLPQVVPVAQVVLSRGAPLAAMLLQVPTLDGRTQLLQPPAQIELQQTPSPLQMLLAQSLSALQPWPLANLLPQRLLVVRHVSPPTQSLSDVQVVRHDGLVALHLYGSQFEGAGVEQLPAPSQFAAGWKVLPVQLACRQPTLVDHGLHAPLPLQVPSFEQFPVEGLLAAHRCFGSGWPSCAGEQVPTLPGTLQLMHSPPVAPSLQAVLQQTPSVQVPLLHCLPLLHAAPFALRPQELFTQVFGGRQSLSRLQVERQALPLQVKVPQETSAACAQLPRPSQAEAGVREDALEHAAGLQGSPCAKVAHAPALQVPVFPQVD
jgi:hypothetical protein